MLTKYNNLHFKPQKGLSGEGRQVEKVKFKLTLFNSLSFSLTNIGLSPQWINVLHI